MTPDELEAELKADPPAGYSTSVQISEDGLTYAVYKTDGTCDIYNLTEPFDARTMKHVRAEKAAKKEYELYDGFLYPKGFFKEGCEPRSKDT